MQWNIICNIKQSSSDHVITWINLKNMLNEKRKFQTQQLIVFHVHEMFRTSKFKQIEKNIFLKMGKT